MYDYLIVGAGPYGATFARRALEAGKTVLVVDRRPHVAGNCFDRRVDGINVHQYGPHIFHTKSERIWRFVNRFAEFNHFRLHVKARSGGATYSMPPGLAMFHALWGVSTPDEARARIEADRIPCDRPGNLRDFVCDAVGLEVYSRFYEGYSRKQWGRDPATIPVSVGKRLPIRTTWDDRYFTDEYEGIPKDGYAALVANLLDGADIHLGVDYLENQADLDERAEHVLYTGPLDEFFGYRHGPLDYRSLRFEHERLSGDHQGTAIVNYPGEAIPFTRITEHKHFALQSIGPTIITREYPEAYRREAGQVPCYPVDDATNRALHALYLEDWRGLGPKYSGGGRLFDFKYYDMDQTIGAALARAGREFGAGGG